MNILIQKSSKEKEETLEAEILRAWFYLLVF